MKDYNNPTYTKDYEQRKFNSPANLVLAISGTAAMDGYTVISATDSVTGKLVSWVKGISDK